MQLTPIRLTFATGFLMCAGACGQVTGLSNDYVYDLQDDGGGSVTADAKADTSATADAAKTDAPTDAPVTPMDAATCTSAQAASAEQRFTTLNVNASNGCKTCLSNDCCVDVDFCLNISECRRALECRLNCTTLSGTDRHNCFTTCDSNSGGNTTPASYTSGVGACAASKCSATTECGFQ